MTPLVHRVRAVNESRSANPVHDDEFARRLGFRGGLVPGVTVYGYLAVLPDRRWGAAWRAGGTMSARFAKPFYDGEDVTVTATADGDALELEARNPEGVVCATGRATLAHAEPPPDPDRYPAPELPEQPRPPLDVAEGEALGALRTVPRPEPSWPARLGNEVLMANVALPPWIHVETRTLHLAELREGEPVEVRALVAAAWERRGHHFVDLDVLVLGESGRSAAHLRHIAIVTLAPNLSE